jgi:hypothetical protein
MRLCRGVPDHRVRILSKCLLKERFIVRVDVDVEILPVIQSRAADLLLGDLESKRFNKMKGRSCDNTGTSDITGIAGYFRLMQYNVHQFSPRSLFTNFSSLPSASRRLSME